MPHEVALTARLKSQGWKVKIREKERLEPPHVTVICRTRVWRIGLRSGGFLVPPGGSWKDIPDDLRAILAAQWPALQAAWDAMYPTNPIASAGEEAGDAEHG